MSHYFISQCVEMTDTVVESNLILEVWDGIILYINYSKGVIFFRIGFRYFHVTLLLGSVNIIEYAFLNMENQILECSNASYNYFDIVHPCDCSTCNFNNVCQYSTSTIFDGGCGLYKLEIHPRPVIIDGCSCGETNGRLVKITDIQRTRSDVSDLDCYFSKIISFINRIQISE